MLVFQNIPKDKILIAGVIIIIVGILVLIGNNHVKKMIKKELLREKKKKKHQMVATAPNIPVAIDPRYQEPEDDADIDSYVNPIGINPPGNDNFAQYQNDDDEQPNDPKRFNKSDIMQRDMVENMRI